jgi:uncharacterized protein (TIGR03083 family)
MKQAELLTAMREERAKLDAALDGLTPEQLTAPGVVGDWSVKDVLAHITAWQVDLLTNLFKAQRGQKPGKMKWTDAELDAQNQKIYKEYRDRPLENVLADYRGVHKQALKVVEGLSDAQLEGPDPWGRGKTLGYIIWDYVPDHDTDHLPELLAWRKQHAHRSNGAG